MNCVLKKVFPWTFFFLQDRHHQVRDLWHCFCLLRLWHLADGGGLLHQWSHQRPVWRLQDNHMWPLRQCLGGNNSTPFCCIVSIVWVGLTLGSFSHCGTSMMKYFYFRVRSTWASITVQASKHFHVYLIKCWFALAHKYPKNNSCIIPHRLTNLEPQREKYTYHNNSIRVRGEKVISGMTCCVNPQYAAVLMRLYMGYNCWANLKLCREAKQISDAVIFWVSKVILVGIANLVPKHP